MFDFFRRGGQGIAHVQSLEPAAILAQVLCLSLIWRVLGFGYGGACSKGWGLGDGSSERQVRRQGGLLP